MNTTSAIPILIFFEYANNIKIAGNQKDYLPCKILCIKFLLLELPTSQLISAVLAGFCFQKQASFRLFPMIIFSFNNFRYHSGITNGYQCTYWYYDSDEGNVQELFTFYRNTSYSSFLIRMDRDHWDISSFLHSQHFHPIH